MRFILSKPSDVPTYVEYGAADIGVVGKDTLLEEGRQLYEVLDLATIMKVSPKTNKRFGKSPNKQTNRSSASSVDQQDSGRS